MRRVDRREGLQVTDDKRKWRGSPWPFALTIIGFVSFLYLSMHTRDPYRFDFIRDAGPLDAGEPDASIYFELSNITDIDEEPSFATALSFSENNGETCGSIGAPDDAGQVFVSDWVCETGAMGRAMVDYWWVEVLWRAECRPVDGGRLCRAP